MKLIIMIITLLGFYSFSKCVENDSFNCVKFLYAYDADTLTFDIKDIPPLFGKKIPVRLKGIDAPEIKSKNKCEKEKARIAKKYVTSKMKRAREIIIKNLARDKYFRILADVLVDGQKIADLLLKENLSYPYHGGKKPSVNWCNYKN